MSLSIGTLVGYLQLDDTNFERKAQAADRKMTAMQLHLQALARENPQISVEVQAHTTALDALKAKLESLKAQAADGADVRVEAVQALIEMDRLQQKLRTLHREATSPAKVNVSTAEANAKLDKTIAKASLLHRILSGDFLGGALGFGGGGLLGAILPAATPLVGAGLGAAAFGGLGMAAVSQTNKEAKKAAQLQAKGQALQTQAAEYQKKAAETLAATGLKNSMASQAYLQKAAQLEALALKATTQASRQSLEQRAAAYRQKAAQVGGTYTTIAAQKRAEEYQQKAADYSSQGADLIKQAKAMLSTPQTALLNAQANLKGAFDKLMADPAFLRPFTALFNLMAKDLPLITPLIHAMSTILTGMFRDLGKHPEEFRKFIAWIVDQLPIAGRLLKSAAPLFGNLIHGFLEAAPVGVDILTAILGLLGKLGPATLPVAMGLAGLFLGPEVAAGAAIVGILIQIWTHSKTLRTEVGKLSDWMGRLGRTVGHNLQPILDALKDTWKNDLVPALQNSKPYLKDIAKHIGHLASVIGDLQSKLLGSGGPPVIKLLGKLLGLVTQEQIIVWDGLATAMDAVATAIEHIGKAVGKTEKTLGGGALGTLLSALHLGGGAPGQEVGDGSGLPVGQLPGGKGKTASGDGVTVGQLFGHHHRHNALGTNNWRGGLTWLAENGPELVYGPSIANLAPHSRVVPAGMTKSMLSAPRHDDRRGTTIQGDVIINHPFDGRDVDRHMARKTRTAALGGLPA